MPCDHGQRCVDLRQWRQFSVSSCRALRHRCPRTLAAVANSSTKMFRFEDVQNKQICLAAGSFSITPSGLKGHSGSNRLSASNALSNRERRTLEEWTIRMRAKTTLRVLQRVGHF